MFRGRPSLRTRANAGTTFVDARPWRRGTRAVRPATRSSRRAILPSVRSSRRPRSVRNCSSPRVRPAGRPRTAHYARSLVSAEDPPRERSGSGSQCGVACRYRRVPGDCHRTIRGHVNVVIESCFPLRRFSRLGPRRARSIELIRDNGAACRIRGGPAAAALRAGPYPPTLAFGCRRASASPGRCERAHGALPGAPSTTRRRASRIPAAGSRPVRRSAFVGALDRSPSASAAAASRRHCGA